MIDTDKFDPAAHVAAVAPAVGIALTPERLAEVAAAFALVVRIAGPALAMAVPEEAEPAPVFAP